MSRRKVEKESGVEAGWLATFGDLMNLLLCFFVLLFSMSTVDTDKYEALITSLSESINIFDSGSKAPKDKGTFVSSGTDQLVSIGEYYKEFEQSGTSTDNKDKSRRGTADEIAEKKVKEKMEKEQRDKVKALYTDIKNKASEKDIIDVININTDKNYQYVQISMKGAILFDVGKADVKENAKPILSKIADILQRYKDDLVKIEGHTDNVPMSNSLYRNNMELSTARATSVFIYFVKTKKMNAEKLETAGRGEYDPVASNSTAAGRTRNRRIEVKIYPN